MAIENKFPGKDISQDDLKTKFPLAAKKSADHKSIFDISGVKFGSDQIPIFAGPNMVESPELILEVAKSVTETRAKQRNGHISAPRRPQKLSIGLSCAEFHGGSF